MVLHSIPRFLEIVDSWRLHKRSVTALAKMFTQSFVPSMHIDGIETFTFDTVCEVDGNSRSRVWHEIWTLTDSYKHAVRRQRGKYGIQMGGFRGVGLQVVSMYVLVYTSKSSVAQLLLGILWMRCVLIPLNC